MSAVAGPGPSTMASTSPSTSPIVPTGARSRMKKRVINLVNPADPNEFSNQSMSPMSSPNTSTDMRRQQRESTPISTLQVPIPMFTPRGVDENGVRGILRQTGTPGSGNGVRFFPKNRFRVITPNQSIQTPQKAAPVPVTPQQIIPPPASSFLGHLLSVVPNMSPRRSPQPQAIALPEPPSPSPSRADESWEVPGQEGEVSLIGSSVHSGERSFQDDVPDAEDEGEGEYQEEEPSWSGIPMQICSPLALPQEGNSREVSFQELDLPSTEMHLPEDMSNLMSTRFSPPPGNSFSIAPLPDVSNSLVLDSGNSPNHSWRERDSTASIGLGLEDDDNPTIRRKLSPIPSPRPSFSRSPKISPSRNSMEAPSPPISPTPMTGNPQQPFRSIFADMSAEQADLSWPLNRNTDNQEDREEEQTAFHSIALTDIEDLPEIPLGRTITAATASAVLSNPITPKVMGDITQYFDATMALTPTPLSRQIDPSKTVNHSTDMITPSKALFEAQAAHTSAITAELALYRDLANKLQSDVSERDALLADLNLRAVEGEMMKAQVADLQIQLEELRASESSSDNSLRASSIVRNQASSRGSDVGNRTTVVEAETRDLEIRLAKSLADQELLGKQLSDLRAARDDVVKQLTESKKALRSYEDQERDRVIGRQRSEESRTEEIHKMRAERMSMQSDIEELQTKVREMTTIKQADEEEIMRLHTSLSKAKDGKRRESEVRSQVETLEMELQAQMEAKDKVEKRMHDERAARLEWEAHCHDLENQLQSAQINAATETSSTQAEIASLKAELARLRSQSASKDLEISSLQRRKAELKEDREMLNIALDSKQQEVELMKRKYGVKGVAGSTPLTSSRKVNLDTPAPTSFGGMETPGPHKLANSRIARRSSATYQTPAPNGYADQRTFRHGVPLHASTIRANKVQHAREDDTPRGENVPPVTRQVETGSLRRHRVLA